MIFRRVARANTRPISDGVPESTVDGKFVALTVKPGAREAEFERPSSRLLYPVKMRRTKGIHRPFVLRLLKGAIRPEGMYTDTVVQGPNLHRGVYQSTVKEIEKVGGTGSHPVYNLTPPPGHNVVMVDCNVAQSFSDQEAAGLLAALDPKLILTDGTTLSHRGAYLVYGSVENRDVLFYYEPKEAAAAEHLRTKLRKALLRKALAANISTVQNDSGCGFIFLVPTDAAPAVGMSLGMGPDYVFYSVKPMASTGGRRR